jgi:hypothetical protein
VRFVREMAGFMRKKGLNLLVRFVTIAGLRGGVRRRSDILRSGRVRCPELKQVQSLVKAFWTCIGNLFETGTSH